jgi:CrcB protein
VVRDLGAVVAGGVIGTGARWGLDTLIPHTATTFPVSTILINVVGAFALGLLVSAVWSSPRTPSWAKAGLGSGVLGSFTTFSAFASSVVVEARAGLWILAADYLVATLVLGFGAAALGLWLGGRIRHSRVVAGPDWIDE